MTPDELARSFDLMYRAGLVESMFLSSGIIGTLRTMDEMIATAELVREKYHFHGYLHLKLLPGAEDAQVARAVELADRVSVNLEGPTPERLAFLAPQKDMAQLVGPLRVAVDLIRKRERPATLGWGGARLGMSTQFVVGPAGESDRELLSTVQMLYREVRLVRSYYDRVPSRQWDAAGRRDARRIPAEAPAVPGGLVDALLRVRRRGNPL